MRLIGMFLGVCLFLSAAIKSEAGTYDAGLQAYARQDFQTALENWLIAAGNGDASAIYAIGVLHTNGEGVEKNLAEARNWYQRAADIGHPQGAYNLSSMHHAEGPFPDQEKYASYLVRAGDAGHTEAQYRLGLNYLYGANDFETDLPKAEQWLERASKNKKPQAIVALVDLQARKLRSKDVSDDEYAQAQMKILLLASRAQDTKDESVIKDMETSIGVAVGTFTNRYSKVYDQKKADVWGAILTNMTSCSRSLATLASHHGKSGAGGPALELYLEASKRGDTPSMRRAGAILLESRDETDIERAFELFQQAFSAGDAHGGFALWHNYGRSTMPYFDREKAEQWKKRYFEAKDDPRFKPLQSHC